MVATNNVIMNYMYISYCRGPAGRSAPTKKAQGDLKRSIPMAITSWGLLEERRSAGPFSALIRVGSSISPVPVVNDMELFPVV